MQLFRRHLLSSSVEAFYRVTREHTLFIVWKKKYKAQSSRSRFCSQVKRKEYLSKTYCIYGRFRVICDVWTCQQTSICPLPTLTQGEIIVHQKSSETENWTSYFFQGASLLIPGYARCHMLQVARSCRIMSSEEFPFYGSPRTSEPHMRGVCRVKPWQRAESVTLQQEHDQSTNDDGEAKHPCYLRKHVNLEISKE